MKCKFLTTVIAVQTALMASAIYAQDDDKNQYSRLTLEEIVVTGSGVEKQLFESSVPITRFGAEDIKNTAAVSTSELLQAVPGFWVESNLSEAHTNVFVRGIAQDGGFTFLSLQEDGIPVFPVSTLGFFNPDQLVRLDSMIDTVEVVRGGTSPIFAASAPGGIINMINRRPGDEVAGLAKFTVADYGKVRTDFYLDGPLGDWKVGVGGYYREADGPRDPGFTSSQGGQIKLRAIKELSEGEFELFGKILDDSTPFYLPTPLVNPSNPKNLPGVSVGEYSLISADFDNLILPGAVELGQGKFDLEKGIHDRLITFGSRFEWSVNDTVSIKNLIRYSDADVDMRMIFNGGLLTTAGEFAASQGSTADIIVARTGEVYDPDKLVQDAAPWTVDKDMESVQNIFTIHFDLGNNQLTIGLDYADFSVDDSWSLGHTLLASIDSAPDRLVLAGITDANGFINYSNFNYRANHEATNFAIFASNEWEVTDKLRLDFGIRHEETEIESDLFFPGSVDLDGNPLTLYDNNTSQLGNAIASKVDLEDDNVAWSIGFNYTFDDRQAIFGHYTDSARLRNFLDVLGAKASKDKIKQTEIGYKWNSERLQLFVTLFRSEFDNILFNDVLADGSFLERTASTETDGIEFDGVWNPAFFEDFDMRFSAVYQNPEYSTFVGTTFDYTGNQIRRLPKKILRLSPTVYFNERQGRFTLTYQYYDKRFSNDANERVLPSYFQLNANVVYDWNESFSTQLSVNNITEEVGLTAGDPRTDPIASGPAENTFKAHDIFGRIFEASVSYKF